MILYHGSNLKINKIDLSKCRPYIDIDTLIKELTYKELTDQYSFHTEKAIKYLKGV